MCIESFFLRPSAVWSQKDYSSSFGLRDEAPRWQFSIRRARLSSVRAMSASWDFLLQLKSALPSAPRWDMRVQSRTLRPSRAATSSSASAFEDALKRAVIRTHAAQGLFVPGSSPHVCARILPSRRCTGDSRKCPERRYLPPASLLMNPATRWPAWDYTVTFVKAFRFLPCAPPVSRVLKTATTRREYTLRAMAALGKR